MIRRNLKTSCIQTKDIAYCALVRPQLCGICLCHIVSMEAGFISFKECKKLTSCNSSESLKDFTVKYNMQSSANSLIVLYLLHSGKSLIKIKNNSDPNTDP